MVSPSNMINSNALNGSKFTEGRYDQYPRLRQTASHSDTLRDDQPGDAPTPRHHDTLGQAEPPLGIAGFGSVASQRVGSPSREYGVLDAETLPDLHQQVLAFLLDYEQFSGNIGEEFNLAVGDENAFGDFDAPVAIPQARHEMKSHSRA